MSYGPPSRTNRTRAAQLLLKTHSLTHTRTPCADPGFFSGTGAQARRPENRTTCFFRFFFFFLFFFVLNLFYSLQRGSNGFITEKAILFQGSRGGPTFSRRVQLSPGGGGGAVQIYRNPYNLRFSRGVRTPYPSLDPQLHAPTHPFRPTHTCKHTCTHSLSFTQSIDRSHEPVNCFKILKSWRSSALGDDSHPYPGLIILIFNRLPSSPDCFTCPINNGVPRDNVTFG